MEDEWKFDWMGQGVTSSFGNARLIKTDSIVTMIPSNTNSKYNQPAWELDLQNSQGTALTTTSSLNSVNYGYYVPDKNYFLPVNLQTANGLLSNVFYLYLTTKGKFLGLFVSDKSVKKLPTREHRLLEFYWGIEKDEFDNIQAQNPIPDGTSFDYVVNGEDAQSNWYVISSLRKAVVVLPNNQLQYKSSKPTPRPKLNDKLDPNEILYNRLVNENSQINQYIAFLKAQKNTDLQKMSFQNAKNAQLDYVYNVLFYLYFVILFIVGYMVFMEKDDWYVGFKVTIMCMFVLYPFVANWFEYYMYKYANIFYYVAVGKPIGNEPVLRNIKTVSTLERPYDGTVPLINKNMPFAPIVPTTPPTAATVTPTTLPVTVTPTP